MKTCFPTRPLIALLITAILQTGCASKPTPEQKANIERYNAGKALFDERCKTVAGEKIYKTVENVEGILLLKVRPERRERDLTDPMWPGAAFAHEPWTDEYITTFLGYERSFGPDYKPVTPENRGYIASTFDANHPSTNLPGYRYVDVIDAKDGKRYRHVLVRKPRPTSKIGWIDTVLDRSPAPDPAPRYGVTFEDHVIPEERALGLASSTVKVLDLQTQEVLGELIRYRWSPGKPNSANPSPWLTAPSCGDNVRRSAPLTRQFVDQILKPMQDK